ncbi:MAG: hypothetical protein ABI680_01560 [Chthoniobacteraceae bacterium]
MIRKRFLRSSAILVSSVASILPSTAAKASENSSKLTKKLRETVHLQSANSPGTGTSGSTGDPPRQDKPRFDWKKQIVTTTFWIGEKPTRNNPVPNHQSSWDGDWAKNYGGTDTPDPSKRIDFRPVAFEPQQNPFYVALPYNDIMKGGRHKPEASKVIPWFQDAYRGDGKTVCKGRWIAIRFGDRIAYAQWEDCGPFRTDHWEYVFGDERPKPNLNQGAGLDVSPAVRDYLGMADTDVTDWKFIEFSEVPEGPWSIHGTNNTFVLNKRMKELQVVLAESILLRAPRL